MMLMPSASVEQSQLPAIMQGGGGAGQGGGNTVLTPTSVATIPAVTTSIQVLGDFVLEKMFIRYHCVKI